MVTLKGNSGNNNLTGTTGNDFIFGYDGRDTLTGLAGNDLLDGGSGIDTLIGGSGNDTYIVDRITDVITEIAGGGVDTIKTSISYTLSENYVNNLILTGSGNIDATGNSYDNVIKGNAGKNTLDGGSGIDTLIGGKGDDTYIVDTTTDVIVEKPGEGVDTVISSVSYTLSENYVNNLTLTGTSNINGTGNSYNNVITGNDSNDLLDGGDNLLKGGEGDDTIYAGEGDDTIYGENGNDFLANNARSNYDNDNNFFYGGNGNDTLVGGRGYNALYGGKGNDVLSSSDDNKGYSDMYGGEGNDTLTGIGQLHGESGNDSIRLLSYYGSVYGGLGNDTITFENEDYEYRDGYSYLVFNAPNEGIDTILNFDRGFNQIVVDASEFGGGLNADDDLISKQFAIGSIATTVSQRFLYDTNTGYLRFDVDGRGSAPSTVLAILQGTPTLNYTDILVNE